MLATSKSKYIICGKLTRGTFLSRPNRFTAIVKAKDEILRLHLRDPGRLTELVVLGREVIFRRIEDLKRKTKGEAIGIRSDGKWVLVNSSLHSKIAQWLVEAGYIEELKGWRIEKAEWKYGKSRIDFLTNKERERGRGLLEVKGCTLVMEGVALFPDAPTERGRRHVLELIKAKKEGLNANILFLVLRGDANIFSPYWKTDPEFLSNLVLAHKAGVNIMTYCLGFDGKALEPKKRLKLVLYQAS